MNPQERKSLREKLFEIFNERALKMSAAGDDYVNFEDFATDMESYEWTLFHAKWKRLLTKNEIKRTGYTSPGTGFSGVPGLPIGVDVPWRNIPGCYSIFDPVSLSKKRFILDVPTNLAEKILILGDLP
jgi:hypothetical protein